MSDTATTPTAPGPWRRALREARGIVIVAFLIAVTYNIFASTGIPWMREASKHDSTTTVLPAISDSSTAPAATATPSTPTNVPATYDTAAPMAVDTAAMKGLTQAARDSVLRVQRDSVRLARQEATHMRDSLQNVELLGVMADGKDINTDIAKKIFDHKLALFIDARPEDQFNEGHIAGAINIYAEQWQSSIPDLVKIPRDRPIVAYCGGGDECELSHDLAKSLRTFGFKSVAVYVGGIKDWTAKKYPVAVPVK